jgi:hypothetical protein
MPLSVLFGVPAVGGGAVAIVILIDTVVDGDSDVAAGKG